jgi:group I intron endonuclease
MRDYSKGQIYIIRNHVDDRVYIGSTTRTLANRFSDHKSQAKSQKYKQKLYDAFGELGVDKFYIERLEEYPCNDVQALVAREGYYIRMHDSVNNGLNGKLSGRSIAQYWRENYYNDPAFNEDRRARNRIYCANRRATDPEFRNKKNAYSKQYKAERCATDPEYREKCREQNRVYMAQRRALMKQNADVTAPSVD